MNVAPLSVLGKASTIEAPVASLGPALVTVRVGDSLAWHGGADRAGDARSAQVVGLGDFEIGLRRERVGIGGTAALDFGVVVGVQIDGIVESSPSVLLLPGGVTVAVFDNVPVADGAMVAVQRVRHRAAGRQVDVGVVDAAGAALAVKPVAPPVAAAVNVAPVSVLGKRRRPRRRSHRSARRW